MLQNSNDNWGTPGRRLLFAAIVIVIGLVAGGLVVAVIDLSVIRQG